MKKYLFIIFLFLGVAVNAVKRDLQGNIAKQLANISLEKEEAEQ